MNDYEFGSIKLLKLKYRREDQIIQILCKIGSPQKLGPPSLIAEISRIWENYFWMMQNALKYNEWRRNCVHKTFEIEIQKEGPNSSDFVKNWFPQEIRSPFFNL